jgi:hypothetical protein
MPGLVIDTVLGAMRSGMATEVRNDHNKGWYTNATALRAAWPTALVGDFAIVGSGAGGPSVWSWDSGIADWEDTASSGLVTSVFGRTAAVTAQSGDYNASQVGLGNVTNDLQVKATDVYAATLSSPLTSTVAFSVIGTAAPTISMPAATNSTNGYATSAQITALEAATAAQHARSHALNSGSDHSGTLAATQMPTSGTWTIATASVMTFAPTDATSRIDITCPVSMSTASNNTVLTIQEIAGIRYLVPTLQLLNSQLPLGGNWALTSGLVINSAAAVVDFTINRHTSGKALWYDSTADGLRGDFIKATVTGQNACLGYQAGNALAASTMNVVAIGYQAGLRLAAGSTYSVCIGYRAGENATVNDTSSVFIGNWAGGRRNGVGMADNVFIGYQAGLGSTTTTDNTGTRNVVIGYAGRSLTSGGSNVFIGNGAGGTLATGAANICIGNEAGTGMAAAVTRNICLGYQAGYGETGSYKFFVNTHIRASEAEARADSLIYGAGAGTSASQTIALNAVVTVKHGLTVNSSVGAYNFTVNRVTSGTAFQYDGTNDRISGDFIKVSSGGTQRVALGYQALNADTTGAGFNVGIGVGAGLLLTTGSYNTAIGYALRAATTTSGNTAIGYGALVACTGTNNVAVGMESFTVSVAQSNNIGLGAYAGYYETGSSKLMITAFQHIDEAKARANAIIYGTMVTGEGSATQTLALNAGVTVKHNFTVSGVVVKMANLPTSDPVNAGQLWSDSGTVKVSAGA